MIRNLRPALRGAALACALALTPQAHAAKLTSGGAFGDNPGNLEMYKYVPANLPAKAPLVVALHGCTQTPTDYDDEPGWLEVADKLGFALLFPKQKSANMEYLCFSWFNSGDQQRGKGEPASVINMVDKMISEHNLDPARVFAVGLSGGASFVPVLLATYPERFAGGSIVGGVPYRCATEDFQSLECMAGVDKSPQAWGDLVRKASSHQGPWPKVSIWQGSKDDIVFPKNGEENAEQWTHVHGIYAKPSREETVNGHVRKVYEKDGVPVVEYWLIQGMPHGTPISPGSGPEQCGRKSQYALDVGICASYQTAKFWGIGPSN